MNEKRYAKIYIALVLLITLSITGIIFINPSLGLEFFTFIMFIPGGLAIIFNIIQYKDIKKLYECFKRRINKKAMLFSILYPIIFVFMCALIAYSTGLGQFNDKAFISGIGKLSDGKVLLVRDIIVFTVATILSLPNVLGEEYGWRGYLLPKLTSIYGKVKATAITGVVWGLFHVPAVFLLAKATGMSNPLLLCVIQALAAFTFSFPSSYSFYLSGNIVPALFIHSAWNSINVILLGDIYKNNYGIVKGSLLTINGEGILGLILGSIAILWFVKIFNKNNILNLSYNV